MFDELNFYFTIHLQCERILLHKLLHHGSTPKW